MSLLEQVQQLSCSPFQERFASLFVHIYFYCASHSEMKISLDLLNFVTKYNNVTDLIKYVELKGIWWCIDLRKQLVGAISKDINTDDTKELKTIFRNHLQTFES